MIKIDSVAFLEIIKTFFGMVYTFMMIILVALNIYMLKQLGLLAAIFIFVGFFAILTGLNFVLNREINKEIDRIRTED